MQLQSRFTEHFKSRIIECLDLIALKQLKTRITEHFKSRIIGCLDLIELTIMSDRIFAHITIHIKDYRVLKFNSVDHENVRSQVCTDCNYNQGLRNTSNQGLSVPERSEGTEVSKMAIREGIVFWGFGGVSPPL